MCTVVLATLLTACGSATATPVRTPAATPIDYDAIPLGDLTCHDWGAMSARQRDDATEILLGVLWIEDGQVNREATSQQVDAMEAALTTLCEQRPGSQPADIGRDIYAELKGE